MPAVATSSLTSTTWQRIPGAALAEAIRVCLPAMYRDDTRPQLCAVQLVADGDGLRAVALDGHRVHVAQREVQLTVDGAVLVPARAARAIVRLAGGAHSVEVSHEPGRLHVRTSNSIVSASLIAATFPSWASLVPGHEASAMVDRSALLAAIQRAALAAGSGGVVLAFADGALTVRGADGAWCVAVEHLAAMGWKYERASVRLAPNYLVDALRALGGDRVVVRVGGELEPVLIHQPGRQRGGDLAVLMPRESDQ